VQEIYGQTDTIDGRIWVSGTSQIYIQYYNQNRVSDYYVMREDE
jgi:hypothetical protein